MGINVKTTNYKRRNLSRLNSEINITPFVDVLLVLLIIFMVTAPMLVSGININLPETSANPLSAQDEPLTIDIDVKGKIYLQENLISENELVNKLKYITKEKTDTRIFIRGDNRSNYGNIAKVLDLVNSAGFNKVALLTSIKEDFNKGK